MRAIEITSAIQREGSLEVVVEGRRLTAGEKYTILELGYAVYLLDQRDQAWLRGVGETLPADPEDNRGELKSGHDLLITSDPILVALALNAWWHENGKPQPIGIPLPIPSWSEAVEIVKCRPILNDFNARHAGIVPGLLLRANAGDIEDL